MIKKSLIYTAKFSKSEDLERIIKIKCIYKVN